MEEDSRGRDRDRGPRVLYGSHTGVLLLSTDNDLQHAMSSMGA